MSSRFQNFMCKYKLCIKELDQFGIPITLKAFNNQRIFKSNVGGIITFLIYSFYLSYLIYVLALWQTNKIQPTSVRFSQGKNITTFKFQHDTIFEICYWKYSQEIIDPFTEQDNILMPIFINNLTLTINNNFELNIQRQEGFIIITDCDQKYLIKGQSCASKEHINKFKINQEIRYSNIGEILAQTGSILSVLMMIKSLIQYYQNIILDNMIYYQVLNQWFPEQIKPNRYGMIQEIAGYKSEYQINKLKNLVDSKLDVIDIIYQIQRIQLILIKKFGRGELQEANSYVIQPHAQLVTESVFEKEDEFYIEDLDILKYNFK